MGRLRRPSVKTETVLTLEKILFGTHSVPFKIFKGLIRNGFIQYPVLNTKKKDIEQTIGNMVFNTFLHQPFGSQNSPDYIVKIDNGKYFYIECKSCISSCFPVYNSGVICENTIYIFTSKKRIQQLCLWEKT